MKKLKHMSKKTEVLKMDVLGRSGTDTPRAMEVNIEKQD
jgi:hypothetical protein